MVDFVFVFPQQTSFIIFFSGGEYWGHRADHRTSSPGTENPKPAGPSVVWKCLAESHPCAWLNGIIKGLYWLANPDYKKSVDCVLTGLSDSILEHPHAWEILLCVF